MTVTPFAVALPSGEVAEAVALPTEPASRAVAGLRRGGRVVGMTKGQFSMIDLIRAIIDKTGPAHLQLSTWTAGIRDAHSAAFLLEAGRLLSVRILVDRSFATRQPRYCAAVRRLFGDEAIRCTRTHAKVALISNDDWSVAVRASMNLNRNPRFENFDIDDNPKIFDLFARHFAEMEETMPPGPRVPTAEVDAVFERAARGRNVFDLLPEEAWLRSLGAPLDSPQDARAWVMAKKRENRKGGGVSTWKALAKKVGLSERDLRAALANGPARSLIVDVAAALVGPGPKP